MPSSELGRGRYVAFAVAGIFATLTVSLQTRLATRVALAHETEDLSLLPAAERAPLLSLGFDGAVADILWAKLLVDFGTHLVEKRRFTAVRQGIETLLALEPGSDRVFRFVDTLVLFQAKKGTEDDARYVRTILERGLDAEPTNAKRWTSYAQYLGYLGPSFLTNEQDISDWQRRAGEAFTRALELGAAVDDTRAAAALFGRAGAVEAERAYLERAYALASDDDKPALEARLAKLSASTMVERVRSHDKAFDDEHAATFPGVSATVYRLLRARDRHDCDAPHQWSSPRCLE